MTITDTGPIIALLNRADRNHARCVSALPRLTAPLLTTQACLTEALYLLGRDTGFPGQNALWEMIVKQRLVIVESDQSMLDRSRELMIAYKNIPCDYADAALLALGEQRRDRRIFTLDAHFHAYKMIDGKFPEVVP